jgi:hypothetical protein
MAGGRSLTFDELEALGGGTKIVVTLAARCGRPRQTIVGQLNVDWPASEGPRLELWTGDDGMEFVATLVPGDDPDEDFVVQAEGGQA